MNAARDDATADTESGLAHAFARKHENEVLYDPQKGSWFVWNGTRWARDVAHKATDLMRTTADAEAGNRDRAVRQRICSAGAIAGALRLASADPKLVADPTKWDANPDLLGTPAGTVDLRTGELRAALPQDRITRLTAVGPAEWADCETWTRFVAEMVDGDVDLVDYLQRGAGYALTGNVTEQVLLVLFGSGGEGKSTLLGTLGRMMGDYAVTLPPGTLTATRADRNTADIVRLKGARLATTNETAADARWDEARLKVLTGGDTLAARNLYEGFEDWEPTHKLMVATNHKPGVGIADEALRRRLHLLTLSRRPLTPDRTLPERLKKEWPGILRWAIEGAADWYGQGLAAPEQIARSVDAYLAAADPFGAWLRDVIEVTGSPHDAVASAELLQRWNAVLYANGDGAWSPQQLARQMKLRGHDPGRPSCLRGTGRGYAGMRFRE